MSNDPLSDILRLTEARSVMSGGFVAGGAWSLRFPPPTDMIFAVIAEGRCLFKLDGERRAVHGDEGDVALVSGGKGYLLASDLEVPAEDATRVFADKKGRLATVGDGNDCLVLAGSVSLDPSNAALLTGVLPPLVLVRAHSRDAAALRWIVDRIIEEELTAQPGSSFVSAHLAQLLFAQMLRGHIATVKSRGAGWVRVVSDARVGPALRCMHSEPGRAWTLGALAKAAGMSRTSFAVRFKSLAGVAPLGYLAEWRMRLAQTALRDEGTPISDIAARLGYGSESAFSQAFKRVTGVRPGDYRRGTPRIGFAGGTAGQTTRYRSKVLG